MAWVTGAGQGVGEATALRLASEGAAVLVNDFHLERAESTTAAILAEGGRAGASCCDVRDADAVAASLAEGEARLGPVDVLVNNAGNAGPEVEIGLSPYFWETKPEEWPAWIDTNLYGVMNCCHAAIPGMIERGFGRIVTVISDAGRVGDARFAAYAAAKAGAAAFTRSLALGLGRHGITANSVSLGSIETPGLAARRRDPELRKRQLARYPVPRLGLPEDAAAAIAFLASNEASWITAQTVPVNGGFSSAL